MGETQWRELHRRAYDCWVNMRQRCLNPNHPHYSHYGGRGITIHPDWDLFPQFLMDMGDPPEGLTLERRNNDEGYSRHNCYWATMAEQNDNKRPQKVRNDNRTGIKGVGQRRDGNYIARSDQKSGTKLLYYGPDFDLAVAARKNWELSQQ
jgi:hypothetical protein